MSYALPREHFRFPAGVLALVVHALFFAFLYFSVTWQAQIVRPVEVELWQAIPDSEALPEPPVAVEPPPPPVPVTPPAPAPVPETKPDIVMPEKKPVKKPEPKPEIKVEKKVEKKAEPVVKPDIAAEKRKAAEERRLRVMADIEQQMEREKADQEMKGRAARAAAENALVDEYKARIVAKIRSNIIKPPDVADDARAEFRVTLLPGGMVLSAELKKSSGNSAYDSAVERAILKSQPLPLPPDVALFSRFRVLSLVFRPVEL